MMKPWNEGGREDALDRIGVGMSHDELASEIGEAYQRIVDAGFVLVPKQWREGVFKALEELAELRRRATIAAEEEWVVATWRGSEWRDDLNDDPVRDPTRWCPIPAHADLEPSG